MMKRVAVLALAIALASAACFTAMRNRNRENVNLLSLEMTKGEVLSVMGDRGAPGVSNPYRTEILMSKSGEAFEVLFYYTDIQRRDSAITDDELIPLVLREGRLIGWGWSFMDQAVQKYEIRIR